MEMQMDAVQYVILKIKNRCNLNIFLLLIKIDNKNINKFI